jgi:sugar O-acyltransferase (sialic acid O-acetyltransferase NeuD family)
MHQKVILQGGGGHAKVVIDCLLAEGKEVVAIFDKKNEGQLLGVQRYADYRPDLYDDAAMLIAIGDNKVRQAVAGEVKHSFANAIHPSAIVSSFARIGTGNMILHRTVIQAGTTVGNHVIVNTGSQVDHDGSIGDFVHIAPRAVLCGNVTVGEGTLIGAGAVVLPGIKIGKWAIIGAGAVVTKDVADYSVVAGVPGKVRRSDRRHG